MKKTVPDPFKAKQNTCEQFLRQTLAVPTTGGLEPDPAIRNDIVARLTAQKRSGFNILRAISNLFPARVPIYQAAFAMGIVLFAVLSIRKTQPRTPTALPSESPGAVVDTIQAQRDTPHTSSIDTLTQHPIVNIFSAASLR